MLEERKESLSLTDSEELILKDAEKNDRDEVPLVEVNKFAKEGKVV